MSTNTTNLALGKAQDSDNAETYLVTTLGSALDTLDAHDHSADGKGLAVKRIASGLDASKPAAGSAAGFIYVATDTDKLYVYDGTTRRVLLLTVGTNGQVYGSDGTNPVWTNGGTLALIADTVLGASATNITFSSIPGIYKHLRVVFSGRSDRAAARDDVAIQLNGDAGANYDYQSMSANNAAPASSATAGGTLGAAVYGAAGGSASAGVAGQAIIDFPDYASTTLHKAFGGPSGVADQTAGNSGIAQTVNHWRSTAAVTSIKLFPNAGTNFLAGTRATLYGLS